MPAHNFKDLTGQTFCRLTVIERTDNAKSRLARWLCRCSCGNLTTVTGANLRNSSVQSCGCLQQEIAKANGLLHVGRHGHAVNRTHSPTYNSWSMMLQRCTNPSAHGYGAYGGAGIAVTPEWMIFENFLADMGERPEGTTLSRFGDVGNYCKENCAWHTPAQQRLEADKKSFAAAAA